MATRCGNSSFSYNGVFSQDPRLIRFANRKRVRRFPAGLSDSASIGTNVRADPRPELQRLPARRLESVEPTDHEHSLRYEYTTL